MFSWVSVLKYLITTQLIKSQVKVGIHVMTTTKNKKREKKKSCFEAHLHSAGSQHRDLHPMPSAMSRATYFILQAHWRVSCRDVLLSIRCGGGMWKGEGEVGVEKSNHTHIVSRHCKEVMTHFQSSSWGPACSQPGWNGWFWWHSVQTPRQSQDQNHGTGTAQAQ